MLESRPASFPPKAGLPHRIAELKHVVLTRYCDDHFEPESATATIGIDFKVRLYQRNTLWGAARRPRRCLGLLPSPVMTSSVNGILPPQIKKLSVRGKPYRLTIFDTV